MFRSRLGDFIQISKTETGQDRVVYAVPDSLRPPHWPSARPLPALGSPIGDLGSPAFAAKVESSVAKYDDQLELYWRRADILAGSEDRSVRTLGDLYRVENRIRYRYAALKPASKVQNDRYIRLFAEWADANGAPSMATITRDALIEYLELYDDHPTQKKTIKSVINLLMQTAIWVGWREDNPVKDIRLADPEAKDRDFWTANDVERYKAATATLGHPAIGAMIEFMYETGQRPTDAREMQHGLTYSNGYIRIRQGKRSAVINGKLKVRDAAAIEAIRYPGSRYLFTDPDTGTGYTRNKLTWIFEKARATVVQPDERWLVLATLRHTFVVRQVAADVHPFDIAAMTGHAIKSIYHIMERYCIRDSSQAMRALMKLNRAEGGSDEDFGEYDLRQANFIRSTPPRKARFFGEGLERRRAIQFAKRYLEPEELEQMLIVEAGGQALARA